MTGKARSLPPLRVGLGYDSHRLADGGTLRLGGVQIDCGLHLVGHSDADVLLHAIADAILGACALGDIGEHFPDTDPAWRGADSRRLLAAVVDMARGEGWRVASVDATVIAERPRIAPFRDAMRAAVASAVGASEAAVSIKATTNEGMGFVGRGEGIAAIAVVLVIGGAT